MYPLAPSPQTQRSGSGFPIPQFRLGKLVAACSCHWKMYFSQASASCSCVPLNFCCVHNHSVWILGGSLAVWVGCTTACTVFGPRLSLRPAFSPSLFSPHSLPVSRASFQGPFLFALFPFSSSRTKAVFPEPCTVHSAGCHLPSPSPVSQSHLTTCQDCPF